MTPLYEIALPLADNAGRSTAHALEAFERRALDLAGGYTKFPPAQGVWLDNSTTYVDDMVSYRLACPARTFKRLLSAAFDLFPDQVAIFTARLGTAHIVRKPSHVAQPDRSISLAPVVSNLAPSR